MVKQNIIVKKKKTKPERKCAKKLVVQVQRLSSSGKLTKALKNDVKTKVNTGYLKDSTKKNCIAVPTAKKKKVKPGRKVNPEVNSEKYKFSIVDYLRTSISDKLSAEDVKKLKKSADDLKKVRKHADCENKPLNDCNDFGSIYDLADDFIDIPLDVVITTDAAIFEEKSSSVENCGHKDDTTDGGVNSTSTEPTVSGVMDSLMSSAGMLVNEAHNQLTDCAGMLVNETHNQLTDGAGEVCDINNSGKVKDLKGTHFLLTDDKHPSKSCEVCSASFSCAYKLKRHMLSHSDERKFFCDTCGNGFKTNYHLSRHLANVHSIVGIFACELCDKRFASKLSVREHKLEEHPSTSFLCSICSRTYASRKGLKRHIKQLHPSS